MIASMTAFGRLEHSMDWGNAIWEIRTVNHRYLEMIVRLPEEVRMLEPVVRQRIAKHLKRGKVDCTLRFEQGDNTGENLPVNLELARKIIDAADSLPLENSAPINPMDILRWPGVIGRGSVDMDTISDNLLAQLDSTLAIIVETREREGEKIRAMLLERCDNALDRVTGIRKLLPDIVNGIRERYLSRAREHQLELDNERLEQEMLLLAQKMDVAEELDRLETHINEVQRVLDQDEPVGRRLDFLMQEMNREANTLGSKSASIDTTNTSVELKVLIEQMREQIQNVE
ncbi:MAG: YicC/YloC family endoribonuclease [Gammaproteobacteria bacterium]